MYLWWSCTCPSVAGGAKRVAPYTGWEREREREVHVYYVHGVVIRATACVRRRVVSPVNTSCNKIAGSLLAPPSPAPLMNNRLGSITGYGGNYPVIFMASGMAIWISFCTTDYCRRLFRAGYPFPRFLGNLLVHPARCSARNMGQTGQTDGRTDCSIA